ncbi:MerR family transcriptional regulator [Levilactobacillus lindianensis]|uniref:MerR family transcriptional regulator n=1 Tax=Levilactobacillus lindianensis TaxID=2486018 RepID=UPI001CDBEC59|nr:MerR family transcriptional regulator [Levilactobacillus lindianensis]
MIHEDAAKLFKKIPMEQIVLGIGDVAKATGVSQSQIRYWERKGYIESQVVEDGKNRKFSYKTLLKVQQIKMHMDDGYTLVAAVKLAQRRGAFLDALRSFFEERFVHIELVDDDIQINMGVFDPDPTKDLVAERIAGKWEFKLVAHEK